MSVQMCFAVSRLYKKKKKNGDNLDLAPSNGLQRNRMMNTNLY